LLKLTGGVYMPNISNCPTSLLHFTSFEKLKSILKSKCLWARNSNQMNDPLESLWFNNMLLKYFQRKNKSSEFINDLKKDLNSYCGPSAPSILGGQYYLLSLFDNQDASITQWAYYGDSGYGVCLKIDEHKLIDKEIDLESNVIQKNIRDNSFSNFTALPNGHLAYLAKLVYAKEEDFCTLLDKEFAEIQTSSPDSPVLPSYIMKVNKFRPLLKAEEFHHEKEVRLIIHGRPGDGCEKSTGRFNFIPECNIHGNQRWEIPLVFNNECCINGIQIGPRFFEKYCVACLKDIDEAIQRLFPSYDRESFFSFSENRLMQNETVERIAEQLTSTFSETLATKFRTETLASKEE